jgi:hypothetical protein
VTLDDYDDDLVSKDVPLAPGSPCDRHRRPVDSTIYKLTDSNGRLAV